MDFICQVDEDPTAATSTVSGGVVGACVRSTTASDGRIRLDRGDAATLLRATFPICLVLVHIVNGEERFFHRFVDVSFAVELMDFIEGDRRTYSLTPRRCREEVRFRADAELMLEPDSGERRRLALAQRRVGRAIADVAIEVRRHAEGQLTLVTAFTFFDYFEQLEDADRRQLYAATFGAPAHQQQRLRELGLRHDVLAGLRDLPQPYVLSGFTIADPADLVVIDDKGEACCEVSYTSNGEHSGYAHDAGFALTISHRKLKDDVWVHELAAFADPDVELDLLTTPQLFSFLERCVPGASIRTSRVAGSTFDVENFKDLPSFGWFAGYLRNAARLPGWTGTIASLRDALDAETLDTLAWLSALARAPDVAKLGFVLGEQELAAFTEEAATWRVPVVANTVNTSVISWVRCEGRLLTRDGTICGLRTDKVLDVRVETHNRIDKGSADPEFVIDRPSLVLARGREGDYKSPSHAEDWPCQLMLE